MYLLTIWLITNIYHFFGYLKKPKLISCPRSASNILHSS